MTRLLMPKATAVWLIDNTTLSFDQIADFCGLHTLEVQSIADGEVAQHMVGVDPVRNGQLTRDEIARCEADPAARLRITRTEVPIVTRAKGPRYTPVARRQDRPDGIAWLLKNFPQLSDGQISRLVGTTKPTIKGIRERTHWNITNIKPQDPVALGLCTREELQGAIDKANRAIERAEKQAARAAAREARAAEAEAAPPEDVAVGESPEEQLTTETEADIERERVAEPEPGESGGSGAA
jgi:uncharacterized protein